MIASVRTDFDPLILFLFLLMTIFSIFIAAGSVEIYRSLADNTSFLDVSGNLHLTNIIFSKYAPLFMSVFTGLILIIMYSKQAGGKTI
jgi:hypothetical protein